MSSKKLTNEKLREIHSLMVETRVLEERLIRMNQAGEGYFWIGPFWRWVAKALTRSGKCAQ
jgi:hypothetical protein